MSTNDAVRALLAWLATYGLHSTLFLGGAWALCALRPPRLDRNRERLWKLALVGGLASATLQLASGARPVLGSIHWQRAEQARADVPVAELPPPSPAPARERRAHGPALETELEPDVEREVAERSASTPPALAARSESHPAPRLRPDPGQAVPPRAPAAQEGSGPERAPSTRAVSPETSQAGEPPAPGLLARLDALDALDAQAWSRRWPGLVLGLWIASGCLGLFGLLVSWTCLRRRLLGRRLLVDGPLVARLEQLRAQAGVRQRVRLSVSPRIAAPFSTGFFRPEVCLPTAVLTTLSRAQQEALLAHELAHVVRRDPAWFGLGFVIEKLFFFQPLNRLARRQLSELAEVACDDWAVRWTGARLALASCLTEVAGWVVGERPRLVTPPGLAGHRSRLGQRVARLLDDRRSPAGEPPARWWPPLAAGALASAALAVPGVSASGSETHRDSAEQAPASATIAPRPIAPSPGSAIELERPADRAHEERPEEASLLGPADERGVLESELALLESELGALHAELEARALRARFAEALQRIDARMAELRAQQARARALLARLATPNTPASRPAPLAEALPPTTDPGDSR